MLCAMQTPRSTFFSCAVDFRSDHWMGLLNETIYDLPLGAPKRKSAVRDAASGVLTRARPANSSAVPWSAQCALLNATGH